MGASMFNRKGNCSENAEGARKILLHIPLIGYLGAPEGLLGEPKSFSHNQDPALTSCL